MRDRRFHRAGPDWIVPCLDDPTWNTPNPWETGPCPGFRRDVFGNAGLTACRRGPVRCTIANAARVDRRRNRAPATGP